MIMDFILIILLFAICICFYLSIRNNSVYKFRTTINDIGYNIVQKHTLNCPIDVDEESYNAYKEEHERLRDMWLSLSTNISYDKMLFSIKPLKPKYWLNKEQMEFLNYYESTRKTIPE